MANVIYCLEVIILLWLCPEISVYQYEGYWNRFWSTSLPPKAMARFLDIVFLYFFVCISSTWILADPISSSWLCSTMFDPMEEPVQLGGPSTTVRFVEHGLKNIRNANLIILNPEMLYLEIGQSLLVSFLHRQCFPQVTNVIYILQLCK